MLPEHISGFSFVTKYLRVINYICMFYVYAVNTWNVYMCYRRCADLY